MQSGRRAISSRNTRFDIEGLRAIAVLAVVFFHLNLSTFQGGFSGVDIFFVISGYLITRNILIDVEAGTFSFQKFYTRRIRRIFPAMLATIAIALLLGALWFPPEAYADLAKSSFFSLIFVANIFFWWDSHQYFAANSALLPLLHLWSLSVEEQFYIIWPLVSRTMTKARGGTCVLIAGTIAAASLLIALIATSLDRDAAFYLTPFRIHQFALGALIVFIDKQVTVGSTTRKFIQFFGVVLCAVGIFSFDATSRLPTLASSLGAALIIQSNVSGILTALLTNRASIAIGRISYSLYLVHWPIVVFARYIIGETTLSTVGLTSQLILMFITATTMHRFVELPFLGIPNRLSRDRPIRLVMVIFLALAVTSLTIATSGGWQWRLNSAQKHVNELEAFGVTPCTRDQHACTFGAPSGKAAAVLIGDSYAQHYVAAINEVATNLDLSVEEQIQGGCLILSGILRLGYPDNRCRIGRDRILAAVKQTDLPIIISQAWMGYLDGSIGDDQGRYIDVRSETRRLEVLRQALQRTIEEVAYPYRQVLIIGAQVLSSCNLDVVHLGTGPLPHARDQDCAPKTYEEVHRTTRDVNDMLESVRRKYPNIVSVLNPENYMCDETCPTTLDGIWLYQDPGHLTVAGSLYFGRRAYNKIAGFLLGNLTNPDIKHSTTRNNDSP